MPRKSKFLDDKTVKFDEEETVPELGPPARPPAPSLRPPAPTPPPKSSRVSADADTMDSLYEHPDTLTDAHIDLPAQSDELVIQFRDESEQVIEKAVQEFEARQTPERPRRRTDKARTTVVAVKKPTAAKQPSRPEFTDDDKTKERK